MKPKLAPLFILMLLTLSCQTNHENKDGLRDSVPKNKDTSIEQIVKPDTGNRNSSLYSNIRHQITFKASNLKSDENFNKYLEVEVTNSAKKKIVAISFLVNNNFYSGSLREKITVKSNSVKSFKLYLPDNIPRPELLRIFLNQAIFYDGEIYNTLPQLKAY